MKISVFIILAACLQVSARGTAQTVTYTAKSVRLADVFAVIKKQTGYIFFYRKEDLQDASPVTVQLKAAPLSEALSAILAGQPLIFNIQGNTVFIARLQSPGLQSGDTARIPQKTVKVGGTVYNEGGEPLSGANIVIKELSKGTSTNVKGEFQIPVIAVGNTLFISFIGYAPQQIKIKDGGDLRIFLKATKNELDKVVIQAYGTTSQRLTTGSISTVTAEEIGRQPVINPLQALQGEVPGLDITQTSGYGSAPFKVQLRGQNTINPNLVSEPLYIIDGVPLTISELNGGSGSQGGSYSFGFIQNGLNGPAGGQSPFASINPADIESVEVLKDADATSIYGSRGANGVILITTKKGKAGKTKFDLNIYEGENRVTRYWDMLNTQQYLSVRREALKNDGISPNQSNAPDLVIWDTTRYTDWQKFLWGHAGKNLDAQASLSGGNAQTTFRLGAGYTRTTDITTKSGSNQRSSFSIDLSHKSLDEKLGINFNALYTYFSTDMTNLPGSVILPPDAPSPYDKNGNPNYQEWDASQQGYPFASLWQPYTSSTKFLNAHLGVNYELAKGLILKATGGYNDAQAIQTQLIPIASEDTYANPNVTGIAEFGNNRNSTVIFEPQIEYKATISKGRLNGLVGASYQSSLTQGAYVGGNGYTADALLGTISNAAVTRNSDSYGKYKYAAIFGRINYDWQDKYIINLTARRDGSSRFGPGKQFGDFGSAGLAWILSEEPLFKKWSESLNIVKTISFLKLRTSYGTTGSDAVGDYQYLSRWQSNVLPYNGVSGLLPIQHVDSTYQWQVNKKFEAAFDIGLFQDRVTFEVSRYINRCGNQLLGFPLAAFTGFTSVTANTPAKVQNAGWEYTLKAKLIHLKNFDWTLDVNVSFNSNKLISYPNLAESPYASQYVVGQPLNITYLYHYIGIDPLTGNFAFKDKNHDGQITESYSNPGTLDDRYIYNLNPKFFGGLGNTFRYKNWMLTAFFLFKKQIGINALNYGAAGSMINYPVATVKGAWQEPGGVAQNAKYTTLYSQNNSYFPQSDGVYTDASFIRLKNATLTYSVPAARLLKLGLHGISVFFRGENLFVFTKYKGLDPETQNFGGMPPNKIFTGGLSFNF